jgi:hypothetical protein
MSKPIFIIRFPEMSFEDGEKAIEHVKTTVKEHLHDYHVLPVVDRTIDSIQFECFNSPHTEIEFEELKENVLNLINKNNNE